MPESPASDLKTDIRRRVDAACEVWIRRLIDPSRANSLLFYRDLKVGTLDLTAQRGAVRRLLAGEKLTVESLAAGDRSVEGADPVMRGRVEGEARQKLRSTLVALQRKALSNLEEKGIETLHLAIGMATWPASDGGRPYDAPVLLLPARIDTRGRVGENLCLAVDGEPQINPVLLHILEENYAIRIDGARVLNECGGEDEAGQWRIDPEEVFAHIERAVASVAEALHLHGASSGPKIRQWKATRVPEQSFGGCGAIAGTRLRARGPRCGSGLRTV